MNKTEYVNAVAKEAGVSVSTVEKVVKAGIDVLTKELKTGNKVQFIGFGTFEAPIKEAHKARNPQTGKETMIDAKRVPKFKAGKTFKDSVQ